MDTRGSRLPKPYLSAYKIDLKTMQDKKYRQLGGVLENVLNSIKEAHRLGLWVEVVTLVVPGFNDSTEELMERGFDRSQISLACDGIHPDYKMVDPRRLP
jgi:pyruvate formate lyase activating enzyme